MCESPPEPSPTRAAASMPQQSSRKRVFTFQKRWLHSLPITERSLPQTEMDTQTEMVIVCMLCEDPASKREMPKVWRRLNCRRGRIENHVTSKHPEFMRLLQHKREAEGDLAVQIFLQNLRDGRCKARTEINNGLYSELAGRGDDVQNRHDVENSAKRVKLTDSCANDREFSAVPASVYSAESMAILRASAGDATARGVDTLTPSVLYQDAVVSAQWQTMFFNKLVVVTGADNQAMSTVATQLWLLGANVVLTFTNMSALENFHTKHMGCFTDPSGSEDSPRGVMLPVLGLFRTQSDISEWCSSIATKYQRVDVLINYVGSKVADSLSSEDADEDLTKSELVISGAALLEILSESMSSTCFPDRAAGENVWLIPNSGTIVNVAPSPDSAAIESFVKALAVKLQPRNIKANCVLLPSRQVGEAVDVMVPNETATLLHSILFLLSPSSQLLSGSVLRIQQDTTLSHVPAAADRRTDGLSSVTEAADATTDIHSI